jgi:uncharacterized protein (DUF2141 family)
LRLFLTLIAILVLFSCARRGRPDGGPKDFDKPIMVRAEPEFLSLQFDDDEIKIYFDEFVKLQNVTSQLIVSPPLKYPPVITPQGTPSKRITIKLSDTLQENTTYTFNFGQSIEDNTERNVLDNFKYIISTGDYIDSLRIGGRISDSFDLEMTEGPTVMLFPVDEHFKDSIVFKEKPTYVGSTVDSLSWSITNIKAGKYRLIALNDQSKNYLFNPSEDKIAFYKDFIEIPGDTVFDLRLFREILPFDIEGRPKDVSKGHLIFGFKGDASRTEIKPLTKTPDSFKSFLYKDREKDTLHYFMSGFDKDSIRMLVVNGDRKDTVRITLDEEEIDSMKIGFSHYGLIHPRDTLKILSNVPVMEIDSTKFRFLDKDSVRVPFKYELAEERGRVFLYFEQKFREEYRMEIDPGGLKDIFGISNDSIRVKFKTGRPSDYCSVFLSLRNINRYPIIVDLINDRGMIVGKAFASEPREFEFKNLEPARFKVRIIYDDNENRKWDTGSFLELRQPEEVYYFKNVIDAKANWEVVEQLILEP